MVVVAVVVVMALRCSQSRCFLFSFCLGIGVGDEGAEMVMFVGPLCSFWGLEICACWMGIRG